MLCTTVREMGGRDLIRQAHTLFVQSPQRSNRVRFNGPAEAHQRAGCATTRHGGWDAAAHPVSYLEAGSQLAPGQESRNTVVREAELRILRINVGERQSGNNLAAIEIRVSTRNKSRRRCRFIRYDCRRGHRRREAARKFGFRTRRMPQCQC